jgi:hypothetical protein
MADTYDWIDGTYDITKNQKRMLISDVIDELNTLDKVSNELERISAEFTDVLEIFKGVIRERNHLRAKLAEVYGQAEE